MTLETQVRVPLHQHLVVRRTMRVMAGGATFPYRLVFEDKWPALRHVALRAGITLTRQVEWPAHHRLPFVRIVAVAAAHLSVRDRMRMRQAEPSFHLQMALEADFR